MFLALHRLFPPGDGELLNARAQGVLDKHPMLAVPPSVQALLYPPSDGVGCGDMLGLFQYHRLKNDEPLKVPLSVLHPLSSSPSIPTNLIPTFLLGASYHLNGMTGRSRRNAFHAELSRDLHVPSLRRPLRDVGPPEWAGIPARRLPSSHRPWMVSLSPCLQPTWPPLPPSHHSPFAIASSVASRSPSVVPRCRFCFLSPFPVLPSAFPLSDVPSRWVWGARLEHRPRHRHVTQTRAALHHLHRAVLHVNVGPHSQQALTSRQAEYASAVVCSSGAILFSFPTFSPLIFMLQLASFAWPSPSLTPSFARGDVADDTSEIRRVPRWPYIFPTRRFFVQFFNSWISPPPLCLGGVRTGGGGGYPTAIIDFIMSHLY